MIDRGITEQEGGAKAMETRGKRGVLTGGMILIALGVLIIMSKMNIWVFSKSWPLLLMVIALGALIQRSRDLGGWIIGCVGLIFLIMENLDVRIYAIATFLLPLLLILVGLNILIKYFKNKNNHSDK
jgi:predicted membrane protein